ncbi:hypothetical protein VSH64_22185 [Amycolatopsis rhabdoformis]|uniref:Uncharacterized protein n=1 Tax=Amycolatopsis rhabdoformis TaxID=1448059 RepID=A0ABZ1IJU1_9PSEU|nr:hypothetical protein [Amycolatopsis rhabdoformis]WSE34755.1 hypothetical protein VSH64_22185 [Amycolatopsis rhabdoformis]
MPDWTDDPEELAALNALRQVFADAAEALHHVVAEAAETLPAGGHRADP